MLRVRNEGGKSLLTFKGPVQPGPMKLREECETVVADGDMLLTILQQLGLHVWFRYEKYREEFSADDVVIAIDETPVGTFVEIEGGEAAIHDRRRRLAAHRADYITDSYRLLFLQHRDAFGLSDRTWSSPPRRGMSRLSRWPALVLTAGLGTRLHPLSLVRAKAALPVAGEALISRILRRLRDVGIERVVLNLHHLADTITREVGDGSQFGLDVRYSWEPAVLGSAGGTARAIPLLEADRFLVINGDTMADVDLEELTSRHVTEEALVTMAVVEGDPRYGGVVADERGRVVGFVPPSLAASGPASFGGPSRGTTGPFGTSTLGTSGTLAPLGTPGTLGTFHFVGVQAVNASAFVGVDPNRAARDGEGFVSAPDRRESTVGSHLSD